MAEDQTTDHELVDAEEGLAFKLTKKQNNGIVYTAYWYTGLWAAKGLCKIGVTPNTVTWLSLVFYVLGGVCFWQGTYVYGLIGALLFLLGLLADATDGKMARLTDNCSYMGIWLDNNIDSLRYLFIYPPIAYAAFRDTGAQWPLLVALTAVALSLVGDTVSYAFKQFPFAKKAKESVTRTDNKLHRILKQFYFTEGIEPLVALAFAAADRLLWYIVLWSALITCRYLAIAFVWGRKVAENDRNRKTEAS
jgi:hypothetical protein